MVRKLESLASESATLHSYLREIASFPRLTPDDEQQLGHQIRQDGNEEALGRLVQGNLRFVAGYVRRFQHVGVPLLALIHEGNLGLIEAARRFDPASARAFQAHALWWVRQAVMHLLAESPRVSDISAAGLMEATMAGRQVAALRIAIDHALSASAPAVDDDAGAREPLLPMRRRGSHRSRKGDILDDADFATVQALRQHTVLRSYLN